MSVFQAAILGIIQGLTEFLPVSSSGHLIFIPKLLGWADQGVGFDVVVHLGTLVAVIVFFRLKLVRIIKHFFVSTETSTKLSVEAGEAAQDRKLGWLLILSVIPAVIFGFLISEVWHIEFRSPAFIAWNLVGWGLLLGIADWYTQRQAHLKSLEHIGIKTTFGIACAQAIALIPGTSRSGITMTAGLFSGLSRTAAAEFSFLMSIPIIAMAGALNIFEMIKNGSVMVSLPALISGFFAAALSGFLAIWMLMKIVQRYRLWPFVVYRVVIGILILVFLV
ncbi:MAG: undecaprenyl-diphosphatase UppP [Candidatus Magasanikbacteria bacterium RIFCSPHIGHO2_02_FULL_47_14]|uniref:Undecaprenyl-diphosphatase n=1 Tax=Candidatus Magasanikbacteria bacterium RIFCSPHIGHO2_02_FULL_47_14 TaxID=1798680 RepID=A0A1F6M857_9BACT|nr:MAG: undecaprenyl-diphosphatase UppP [Candidatus Magasanikbacteria bacterium RIFCSPHIGHO2_02_FULL_47_14]